MPVDGAMEVRLISADNLDTTIEPSFEFDIDVAHISIGLYVACIYNFDMTEIEAWMNEFVVDFVRRDGKTFSWCHRKGSL